MGARTSVHFIIEGDPKVRTIYMDAGHAALIVAATNVRLNGELLEVAGFVVDITSGGGEAISSLHLSLKPKEA